MISSTSLHSSSGWMVPSASIASSTSSGSVVSWNSIPHDGGNFGKFSEFERIGCSAIFINLSAVLQPNGTTFGFCLNMSPNLPWPSCSLASIRTRPVSMMLSTCLFEAALIRSGKPSKRSSLPAPFWRGVRLSSARRIVTPPVTPQQLGSGLRWVRQNTGACRPLALRNAAFLPFENLVLDPGDGALANRNGGREIALGNSLVKASVLLSREFEHSAEAQEAPGPWLCLFIGQRHLGNSSCFPEHTQEKQALTRNNQALIFARYFNPVCHGVGRLQEIAENPIISMWCVGGSIRQRTVGGDRH